MALFVDTATLSLATFMDFPSFPRLLNTILNTTFSRCPASSHVLHLVGLITQRSRVQIPPPQPTFFRLVCHHNLFYQLRLC